MLWFILLSILGIVMFLLGYHEAFLIAGFINVIKLIHYIYVAGKTKNIVDNEKYNNEYDKQIARKRKNIDITSKIIVCVVPIVIVYFIFGWSGFAWIGIVFGLFYILELPNILRK